MLLETEPGQKFEGDVAFPENARMSVAGKQVRVSGMVKEVKQRVVPELNDEFAKEADSEFKTVADLKAHTRESLESEAEKQADERLQRSAIDKVVEVSTFELPQSLIEQLAHENVREQGNRLLSRGVPEEVLRERQTEIFESCRQDAEHSVKVHALLSMLADKEDISVNDEDVDAEIGTIRDYGERMGWNLDRLDDHYKESSSRESIQSRLTREKTIEFVVDNAEVNRVEVDALTQEESDTDSSEQEDE
jgi:trigger factor